MKRINLIYNMGINIYLQKFMYLLDIEKASSSMDTRDIIDSKIKVTRLTYSKVN